MRRSDCRTVDPVSLARVEHRSRDRIELGLAAGRDVPLHRRAKLCMSGFELGQLRCRVDLGAGSVCLRRAVSLIQATRAARQSGCVRMKPIGQSQALVVQAGIQADEL